MFTKTAEYALRAAVYLAENPEGRWTALKIAEATQIPAGYLAKVMQLLAKKGVVNAQRGLGGGFTLARAGSELTVLDVIESVDPIQGIESCPLQLEAHVHALCPLHHRLNEAVQMVRKSLESTTLADILAATAQTFPRSGLRTPHPDSR